ncbi:MAG TPA: sensor histidine kinase [Streptosporangiaceae bacterium]|nr:sensor histidine kinase [Streptosporangiaceae bacterium]
MVVTPLGKGIGPRHWALLDYAVGVLLGLILYAAITHTVRQEIVLPPGVPRPGMVRYYPLPWAGPLGLVLVTVAAVAVALRRRRPMFMLGALLAGSVVATALAGSRSVSLTYFLPVCYVLFLIAANYEQPRDAVRALVAVFATLFADTALIGLAGGNGPGPHGALVMVALCVVVVWTAGYLVRQRRRYAVRLQEEAASKAVTQERLRIARELHDVVAHSMSVIAVQAGYGQYVIDSQPGDARAALGAIQATSREALDEMRRMLGALRQVDEPDARDDGAGVPEGSAGDAPATGTVPLSPAPGLADLGRLLSRTAGAGVQVDVIRRGNVRELPASIDLSAYRIVQEALTNVVKHAQTSSCRVLIGYWDDELVIEVTDNGAGLNSAGFSSAGFNGAGFNGAGVGVPALAGTGRPVPAMAGAGGAGPGIAQARRVFRADAAAPARSLTGGHGIIGMRERVSLLGGKFSAGPLPGYGFRVSARIPLPPGGP